MRLLKLERLNSCQAMWRKFKSLEMPTISLHFRIERSL